MPKPLKASDFPSNLAPVIHQPTVGPATNVILFLTGLGDTSANFSAFAKALNLPDSVAVTLQGPFPLPSPFGPGNQWSEDVQIDTSTGMFDHDSPLNASTLKAVEVITSLIDKHDFDPSHIHLFGFGQGGSLALSVGIQDDIRKRSSLGGITSIGGALPLSVNDTTSAKSRTPVMLLGGTRGALIKDEQSPLKRIRSAFEFVEYHQWKKSNDSLPKNRDEAMPMMQFLARRLKSRRGVPEGATEI